MHGRRDGRHALFSSLLGRTGLSPAVGAVRAPFTVPRIVGELGATSGTARYEEVLGNTSMRTVLGEEVRHENSV
jgi:hypothetical protein